LLNRPALIRTFELTHLVQRGGSSLEKFLKKLFGPKDPGKLVISDEVPTVPFDQALEVEGATLEMVFDEIRADTSRLDVGCSQSIGQQRDHNEDALFSLTSNLTKDGAPFSLGLYIVADGMGGHKHGEKASEIAVRSMGSQVLNKVVVPLISQASPPPEESLQEIIQGSVRDAHKTILRDATGGGTTLTAVLIVGGQMTIAHVGDSRAYSVASDGTMLPLTRDHSLVMRMIELGQLSVEEAAVHPQRNVLYRALGQGDPFDPDISTSSTPESGFILICSDGLWGLVPEEDMGQIIITAANPQQACQFLVDAANTAGGPDNITAILVRLPE
jgi:serine/threonine protein phosphatase PrpC